MHVSEVIMSERFVRHWPTVATLSVSMRQNTNNLPSNNNNNSNGSHNLPSIANVLTTLC